MKNLLILIVAVAIFLHFYPQPELESWFNEQKSGVLSDFSEATSTNVKLNPTKIYRDLEFKFDQFNEEEIKFIKELTSSRENIIAFYADYCEHKKSTPKLHRTNQALVCTTITPYQSLF